MSFRYPWTTLFTVAGGGCLIYTMVMVASRDEEEMRMRLKKERGLQVSSRSNPELLTKHAQMQEVIRRAAESDQPVWDPKALKKIAEQVKKESEDQQMQKKAQQEGKK